MTVFNVTQPYLVESLGTNVLLQSGLVKHEQCEFQFDSEWYC